MMLGVGNSFVSVECEGVQITEFVMVVFWCNKCGRRLNSAEFEGAEITLFVVVVFLCVSSLRRIVLNSVEFS